MAGGDLSIARPPAVMDRCYSFATPIYRASVAAPPSRSPSVTVNNGLPSSVRRPLTFIDSGFLARSPLKLTVRPGSRVFGPPSSIESVWSHDLHSIGDDFPSLVLHIDPVIICSYAIGSQGVNPALLNDVASTWSCGCESVRDWFPRQGNDHLYPNSRSKILIDVTPEPLYRMRQNEDATSPSSTSPT